MENYVKEFRTQKGWSQQKLADSLNVSRQTVISIEKGKYDPSLPLAFKVSRLFEKTIEQVFVFSDSDET